MSTIKTNTLQNVAGTLSVPVDTVVQGSAKAWVNFNGTGTVVIRAAFNVSSITDNGTGDYTVNFTTAMPDANYSTSGMCVPTIADSGTWLRYPSLVGVPLQTTSFRVKTSHPSLSPEDCAVVALAVLR